MIPSEAMVAHMTGKVLQLFDLLQHGEIIHAPALPFKRNGFYADMALITTEGNTKIVAESVDLPTGEESFFLNLAEYDADKYWPDKRGVSAWPPRQDERQNWTAVDLVVDIKKSGLGAILGSSRQVRYYRSTSTPQIGARGLLQSAAAVSLGGSDGQLLIYATPEFPCSIEVVMEPLRIRSILSELEEFCVDRS
jgi:hypothetical protein